MSTNFFSFFLDLVSLLDLENDLPDELIPNGDLGMGLSSNGGPGGGGPGLHAVVPDAAAKHKQLSELLRSGTSSLSGGGNLQGGMVGSQLGAVLGKGPLGQGPTNHQSQKGVVAAGQGNGTAGMCFNQTMLNSGQGHGLMGQVGQVMNGTLGPAGRGRPGIQYQGQGLQASQGVGAGGSVLAETLTQGGTQLGNHSILSAQQAGNMNKVDFIHPGPFSTFLLPIVNAKHTFQRFSTKRNDICILYVLYR